MSGPRTISERNFCSDVMKKKFLLLLIGTTLCACNAPVTLAETYSCAGDKDTVGHFIQMVTKDGKVEKFDYSSSTPVSGSVNNCSIESNGAKVSDRPDGGPTFVLSDDDIVVVIKSGN